MARLSDMCRSSKIYIVIPQVRLRLITCFCHPLLSRIECGKASQCLCFPHFLLSTFHGTSFLVHHKVELSSSQEALTDFECAIDVSLVGDRKSNSGHFWSFGYCILRLRRDLSLSKYKASHGWRKRVPTLTVSDDYFETVALTTSGVWLQL